MVPIYGGSELNAHNWALATAAPTVWYGLYSILFATVLTYVLNTWALRHAHSSQVALYINVQPLVAAALAPFVGLPAPDWRFFVALAAVSTALVLQTRRPRRG
jgi:drug/metabolite transporter (DMT)-like permease